jgi:hypothetical protein
MDVDFSTVSEQVLTLRLVVGIRIICLVLRDSDTKTALEVSLCRVKLLLIFLLNLPKLHSACI